MVSLLLMRQSDFGAWTIIKCKSLKFFVSKAVFWRFTAKTNFLKDFAKFTGK